MITEAINYWNSLQAYRNERLRCKNYTYGKQWTDIITDNTGRHLTEEQYIREQGSAPLKNNLIRRIVRNVIGVFRNLYPLPDVSELLEYSTEIYEVAKILPKYRRMVTENSLEEIYSRVLEEYLIGGLAIVKKRISIEGGEAGVVTDIVRPDSFFFNSDSIDPRGYDLRFIGQIHECRIPGTHRHSSDRDSEKIMEIWRKEAYCWRYYFINEIGESIIEGDSPYPGGEHPYVVKAYPFIDGEIHSFVADCIDQQRYINRLITLNDWIIRATAKGVLLFPESAIPDDLDLEDIAAQWSQYNGVIRYKAKAGVPQPQQVSSNTGNIGISELLEVQLKMMEDVSGVNSALRGQISSGNISGALYEQQTRQALTGLTDILEGFRIFQRNSALKDLKMLAMLE